MQTKYKGFYVILAAVSILSLALSVSIVIYLCCSGGIYGISHISFGDTSVTVLCAIIGLLVGWQIYKTIDIEKKVDLISNGSRDAIAEDMFYSAYSRAMNANPNHIEVLNSSVKTCVAALNLNFSEEKAKLLFEMVKSYGGYYYKKGKEVDEMISDLENIKYKSKSIQGCADYLRERKIEEHEKVIGRGKQQS